MDDERLLASLVLLTRLTSGDDNGDVDSAPGEIEPASSPAKRRRDDTSSALNGALVRNNCELLCFAGRLVRSYAACAGKGEKAPVAHACLRLAVRIAFLRYASSPMWSGIGGSGRRDGEEASNISYHLWGYEFAFLSSILAVLRARASAEAMEEVDVEMAWVALCMMRRVSSCGNGKQGDAKNGRVSRLLTETIDAVVARRHEKGNEVGDHMALPANEATVPNCDEGIMVQTIHAILDGKGSADLSNGDDDHQTNDWDGQYDIACVSCMQSYMQTHYSSVQHASDGEHARPPPLTRRTFFGMMRWSQQNHALSMDAYGLVLQCLRLCCICLCDGGTQSNRRGNLHRYYSSSVAQDGDKQISLDGEEEFAVALRSFVFHGLVVLSNGEPLRSEAKTNANSNEALSSTPLRGDIYSLVLELWQLCGPEWLILPSTDETAAATSTLNWWWFPTGEEKGGDQRLGSTWPLCTLVRLAAGEFRLGLGRWVTAIEQNEGTSEDDTVVGSEIQPCAGIIAETTRLMTSLAEDEGTMADWTPGGILHIRTSLEDALNSALQYLNSLSDDAPEPSRECDEIGRSCCLVMGTIAAELEVDHLLATSNANVEHASANKEYGASCFASALRSAILFCHSLGERLFPNCSETLGKRPYEYYEPLTHLLPCIMSLASSTSSCREEGELSEKINFALTTLNRDSCLALAISGFLCRSSEQWNKYAGGLEMGSRSDDSTIPTILSTVELCAMIINECAQPSPREDGTFAAACPGKVQQELRRCLGLWETNLAGISESESLTEMATPALDAVFRCLLVLGGDKE